MSLTQASDTENMQVKINLSDKQSKNGDERIVGMSVSDLPEFTDPAILVMREAVKVKYTRDELIKLREAPLSKKKPDFFDASEVAPAILDPERWNLERKKSDTPTENGPNRPGGDAPDHRRRPGDPRERIRKENDGIVLSPQRRSFNTGCFVPVRDATRSNRPHSPLGGKSEPPHIGVREIQTGTRRIGSGRILRDSWDFNDKSDAGDNDYGFGRSQPQRNTDREDKYGGDRMDSKYERRSFGRDFDMTRDRENNNKEGSSRRNGRYDRRRISDREQEEPEWFSGGPISQNDTIELRGFDESDKPGSKKKLSPSRVKRAKEWSKKKNDAQQSTAVDEKEETSKEPTGRSTPTAQTGQGSSQEQQATKLGEQLIETEVKAVPTGGGDQSFNFDDILKCDSIPGLLTNGVGGDGDNMKSRFSRWFKQETPEKAESRRSSLHDDHHHHHIIKDLLNDISGAGDTNVTIPGDSEAYFAPISPAGNTGGIIGGKRGGGVQSNSQPLNIMEMLQRGKHQSEGASVKPQMAGKILNLDELEANMRRQNADVSSGAPQKHQQQKPDEEMTAAFKKLLAQAQAGGHAVTSNGPMNKSQPMSLLEMLNHSQQQDEAARLSGGNSHLLGPSSPGMHHHHHHHHHSTNDLQLKLQLAQQQKQQMDMLNKLINATTAGGGGSHPSQQMRQSPLHDMGVQQSRELLNRPEAQAILQGLKRGEITTQHLYQQLANPALQPRHREMLVTILKIQGGGYGPSPRVLSPVPPPHHMYHQQQQQLRVSPLPPNAYCVSPILATSPNTLTVPAMHQRIPSPRELQVHTQNILQRALIKKKLEEQQENYRKKQEMQRGQSPGGVSQVGSSGVAPKSVASPTPLAFTPTSVLRKMTADKDEGKENKVTGDGKVPPGRALTGMRPQPQWNPQFTMKQPAGRPIVKANNNYPTQTAEQFFSQHQQQQRMFNQPPPVGTAPSSQQQQQQPRKPAQSQFGGGSAPSNGPGGVSQSQYNSQYPTNQQFAQQLTQQQLRAQHQHRPANQSIQPQPQQSHQGQHQQGFQQGNQPQHMGAAWQQFFNSAQQANRNPNPIGRGGIIDGDLSPTTTNQLARWFSPDLLERARGGELPSTAGLGQHALSLEEIERQTAPPVHN